MSITINFEVRGNKEVTDVAETETITLKGKVEKLFSGVISTDGDIDVPFDKIGDLSKIIIESDSCYLKIGPTGSKITIPIAGLFMYPIEEDYADTIDTIAVGGNSTTPVDISITILGV